MSSADDEYLRNLERWAESELPVFRVADWDGTWLLGSSSGLGSFSSDGTHQLLGTMSQDVWHRRHDVEGDAITITSSRPDGDEYSPQLGNMAIQLYKAEGRDDPAMQGNRRIDEWGERLSSGEFPWASVSFSVDGVQTEFEVLAVGAVWFAFAELDEDVNIEILGHQTPFADLRLTRVTEPSVN